MEAFPAGLPPPLAAGFTQTPAAGAIRSSGASAFARHRRRWREVLTRIELSWSMDQDQLAIFRAWHRDNIARGRAWFTIPLVLDVGARVVPACFIADRALSIGPFEEVGQWLVGASLEVIDTPDLAAVQVS